MKTLLLNVLKFASLIGIFALSFTAGYNVTDTESTNSTPDWEQGYEDGYHKAMQDMDYLNQYQETASK